MDIEWSPPLRSFVSYFGAAVAMLLVGYRAFAWRTRLENEKTQDLLTASDRRWAYAAEKAGTGTWEWNLVTNEVIFSPGINTILGIGQSESPTSFEAWRALIHKDDVPLVVEAIQAHLNGLAPSFDCEYRMRSSDGTYKWLGVHGVIAGLDNTGMPIRVNGIQSDITPKKVADELMQLSTLVYQCSSEAMMVCNRDFRVLSVNPAYTAITGYDLSDIAGKRPPEFDGDTNNFAAFSVLWVSIAKTGSWHGELQAVRKNGEQYLQGVTINMLEAADRSADKYVILFSDVTERKRAQDVIWRQANYDTLTNLPNRHRLQALLADEIEAARKSGAEMAVMMLDLDGFKEVNDTLGHEQGDMLLKEAARRLKQCLSPSGLLARMGGDEFIIIEPSLGDREQADSVAQAVVEKMNAHFELREDVVYISGSVGITFCPRDGMDVEMLLKNADQAMYAAKSAGRNRIAYFNKAMQEAAQHRMQLANDLRKALLHNEFKLVYQPIIELKTGLVYKAEALLRWHHPRRGIVSPGEFIPVAEETGSIVQIGDWVFREAACQAAKWRSGYQPNFQVSVNVSPAQFRTDSYGASRGKSSLHNLGLAEGIVVEITEGLLLDASDSVNDQLIDFRDAGIQVSLDDFGTGYSSLSYLKKFDIDYIKIDQSFVRNMHNGSGDLALCEAIIVMAHKLGMKVIAEGVETEEQRDLLLAAGCDYGQGYLFSRPIPPEELEPMLEKGCLIRSES